MAGKDTLNPTHCNELQSRLQAPTTPFEAYIPTHDCWPVEAKSVTRGTAIRESR